jgi:sugar lactone lactonase YvrE
MRTKSPALKLFSLVTSALVWCTVSLHAQSGPTITTQPASQTNLAGTTVIFTVAVDGTGPFTYQWQFNGTNLSNDIIKIVAGNGTDAYSGDGGPATNASLNIPSGMALDLAGNLYVADTGNNRIRKVDTNGIINTFAGNGIPGYSGDGHAAMLATMNAPIGVALDGAGNMYIGDQNNNVVREVDTNLTISTLVTGLNGPAGVAVDRAGNLFIADEYNDRIIRDDTNGIISVVTTSYDAYGVAVDAAGNVYIADGSSGTVREANFAGQPILPLTTVSTNNAGDYSVVIANPYGSVTSAVAVLTIVLPASILIQPSSQLVLAGSNATLSVTAAGTPPLYYSWYCNTTNLLQNGTNSSFMVPNMSASNSGQYTVVITNAWSSVTSSVATLAVVYPPSVSTQPTSQTNQAGSDVTFTVAVDGTGPFTYLWQFNGTNFPKNIITTVAGNGGALNVGDGGAATNANLHYPQAVATDPAGNLFIADTFHDRIRKVHANGIITTVAGNGFAGFSGEGGAATLAMLDNPWGVALDGSGDFYIADCDNQRVRRVDTNGMITTVAGNGYDAGTGYGGYSGDGGAATNAELSFPQGVAVDVNGNLFFADSYNNRIRKVDTNGIITTVAGNGNGTYAGDGGAATNASLCNPQAVALDAVGNLYIADANNNVIRRVDTSGIITTVAGNGVSGYAGDGGLATNASLSSPRGVALDLAGNLFVGDYNNNRVRKVDTNGVITTVAGNGSGSYAGDGGAPTNASLNAPSGVTCDTTGNLYIADANNNRIRKVSLYGTYPSLTLPDVTATNAGNYTVVITSAYGSVTSAVATLTVAAPPIITVQPASQSLPPGSTAEFSVQAAGSGPFEYLWYFDSTNLLQSGADASLVVTNISAASVGQYTVVVTNAYGSVTSQVATLTVLFPPSVIAQPLGQTVIAGTNVIFSVTAGGTGPFTYQWQFNGTNVPDNIITTVAGNGSSSYSGDGGPATNAGLLVVWGLTLDAAGNLYIADTAHLRMRKVDTNGIITTVAGNGSSGYSGDGGAATNAGVDGPYGVAVDGVGNLYIADTGDNRIRKVDTNGVITTVAGNGSGTYAGDGGAATNASLNSPYGVALDSLGNLYIADTYNSRVRMVGTNGIITTVAGKSGYGYSGDGGAATNASLNSPYGVALDSLGNLYIADNGNNRIRIVRTNGIIATVAGKGGGDYSGDGGAATKASLNAPGGVAVDALGNLFIADSSNNRIRRVDANGIITTVAGNGSRTYAGDGGASTNASLNYPEGVALDSFYNLYIADTFNDRIRKVPPLGYPTLALPNVSADNAGNYMVVITSPYGSVTSAVAVLTVTIPRTPPQIITGDASFGFRTNYFGFNVSGAFGQTIVVDGSTDLVVWAPLFTNTVVGNPFYFCDPASTNYPSRFYRARLP